MNTAINKTLKISTALMLLVTLFVTGCKKVFDEPPYPEEPNISANMNVADFKKKFPNSTDITEDIILKAFVTADDRSGNIYKKIVIQDPSGAAIEIQIDANNIFNSYPAGSWVYVKAKGLSIGEYNGLPQLGLGLKDGQAQRIPSAVLGDFLVKSYSTDVISPLKLTIDKLNDSHLNMLIELEGVQFADAELNKTYANAANPGGTQNRIAVDCSNNEITLRMSDYASFAGQPVARGKGNMIGIYSKFRDTKQFTVRTIEDLAGLTGTRCDGSTGGGNTGGGNDNLTLITIADLRKKIDLSATQHNTKITLTGTEKIKGIIISTPGNEPTTNIRIQEPNGEGILVYIPNATSGGSGLSSFTPGKEVEINLSGQKMVNYYNDYELEAMFENIKFTGETGTITPRNVTNLADLKANVKNWSSSLVKITGDFVVTSSKGTTGTTYTLTSKTNSSEQISSFVRNGLAYEFPTTVTSITGYYSIFSGNDQITIRSASDVVAGDGTVTPGPNPDPVGSDFTEIFATGSKGSWTPASASVTLSSGSYTFNDALIGKDANDVMAPSATQAARIRGSKDGATEGAIYTNFNLSGIKTIEIQHAQTKFSEPADAAAKWELHLSTDDGKTWTKFGETISSERGVLKTETFTLNHTSSQSVRFKIKNVSSANNNNLVRLNISSIKVTF